SAGPQHEDFVADLSKTTVQAHPVPRVASVRTDDTEIHRGGPTAQRMAGSLADQDREVMGVRDGLETMGHGPDVGACRHLEGVSLRTDPGPTLDPGQSEDPLLSAADVAADDVPPARLTHQPPRLERTLLRRGAAGLAVAERDG